MLTYYIQYLLPIMYLHGYFYIASLNIWIPNRLSILKNSTWSLHSVRNEIYRNSYIHNSQTNLSTSEDKTAMRLRIVKMCDSFLGQMLATIFYDK